MVPPAGPARSTVSKASIIFARYRMIRNPSPGLATVLGLSPLPSSITLRRSVGLDTSSETVTFLAFRMLDGIAHRLTGRCDTGAGRVVIDVRLNAGVLPITGDSQQLVGIFGELFHGREQSVPL